MRRAAILLLAVAALARGSTFPASGADEFVMVQEPAPLTATQLCDTCEWMVANAENYINETETKREVINFIVKDVCVELPDNLQLQCETLAALMVPQMVQWVLLNFPANVACKDVGVCPASAAVQASGRVGDIHDIVCPACKFAVTQFVQQATDPDFDATVRAAARDMCTLLPPHDAGDCKTRVDDVIDQLVALLKDIEPEYTCSAAGACVAAPTPLGLWLARAAESGAAAARGAANGACEVCQIAVMEAAALVNDPKTQAAMLAGMRAVCSTLGGAADACVNAVDMYAPVIFNLAEMYLKPDVVCKAIGSCAAEAAAAAASAASA